MTANASPPFVMLHLGLGSFHRAHQALYLHLLHEAGDQRWVLAGGNLRPDMADTVAALAAQGGAYTLETVTPAGERSYTQVRSIRTVVPYQPDLAGLIAIGADPNTRIVSFTVTEAGYYLDAKNRLDLNFPDLVADLGAARAGRPGSTIYGALTALLRARMQSGAGKLTLLNCDNLRHNGERSRGGLLQFIELVGDTALRDWVNANTTSPNAMVDRITPRPTPDVRERVKAATGRDDAAPVMGESFIQWVIEDDFCNGRPAWETVGVEMVASVAPYEEAKIRLLNATHSCIAWAGTLVGYLYIHEGTHDPAIRRMAHDYVTDDVIPCLHSAGSRARSTWRATATWCSTASATRRSRTPTSAWRWTVSARSPASSPPPSASGWRRTNRSPAWRCCRRCSWPTCNAGTVARFLMNTRTRRWTRRWRTPFARPPTRWRPLPPTPCCGARWQATRDWWPPCARRGMAGSTSS